MTVWPDHHQVASASPATSDSPLPIGVSCEVRELWCAICFKISVIADIKTESVYQATRFLTEPTSPVDFIVAKKDTELQASAGAAAGTICFSFNC